MTSLADNLRILQQGIDLLESLDGDLYAKAEPAVSSSGIGSHVRHVTDYYDRMLDGLDGGRTDYDQRVRDERVEQVREAGIEKLEAVAARIEALAGRSFEDVVEVKMDSEELESPPWSRSSLGRELQFQLSHTVHHFALIAVILRLNGHEPQEGFGVAPSTLRYWKESGVCAR